MGATVCSRIDDWGYDAASVNDSPAAYVVAQREIHMRFIMAQETEGDDVDPDDMTIEELRAYYDRGGARRLKNMSMADQQNMFKRFTVSRLAKFLQAQGSSLDSHIVCSAEAQQFLYSGRISHGNASHT